MVDAQQDVTYIPVFNVPRSVADTIVDELSNGRVIVQLPRIAADGTGALNTTSHVAAATSDEWLTQIKILSPTNLAATWDVGQADFNKEFESAVFDVAETHWYDGCNSLYSCHLCNLLESPLILSKQNGEASARAGEASARSSEASAMSFTNTLFAPASLAALAAPRPRQQDRHH